MDQKQSEANGQFKVHAFGKDILIYSLGNGLLLLFGFIQVFVIAKYLSVEDYGYWQLFILYSTYVGLLHLGFIDGILMRWAGKELARVGDEIRTAFRFLILEQVVVIVPLALLLYFLIHPPVQWLWLMVLAYAFIMNLATFFAFTAQAVRKFGLVTAINVGRGLTFLIIIILLFIVGYLSYRYVVIANLIAVMLALFTFAFWFRKYLWGEKPTIPRLWAYGKENINIGIFVLFGNFIAVLLLTTDRLMVSSFFNIEQFAIYAFAQAVVVAVYIFVRAVAEVFFPHISVATPALQNRAYRLGESAIILAWAVLLAGYFPLARLIEYYLPHYVSSLPVMQILLCSIGFGSLIQILHVNYYKVYRKQRQYFLWGITALVITVLLVLLAIKVMGTLESVAIAILLSFGVWYIANELSLKSTTGANKKEPWRSLLIMVCYFAAFWLSSFLTDWFVAQMLIYVGFFLLVTGLALRSEVADLVAVVNKRRESK
ncbi:MAG: oligosaccharide flippase family protein [Dehalococcoidia bacterium]